MTELAAQHRVRLATLPWRWRFGVGRPSIRLLLSLQWVQAAVAFAGLPRGGYLWCWGAACVLIKACIKRCLAQRNNEDGARSESEPDVNAGRRAFRGGGQQGSLCKSTPAVLPFTTGGETAVSGRCGQVSSN